MKLIGSHDRVLLTGFAIAMIVVFARPVRYLLNVASEVERTSGLALVPALVILTVFLVFHLQAKRQAATAQALRAEAETKQADERASDMERLVNFGKALGRSLDLDAIHDAAVHQLPELTGSDEVWVLVRVDGKWSALLGAGSEGRRETTRTRQHIADRAMVAGAHAPSDEALVIDGQMCLLLTAGGQAVGVLGVPETAGPFTEMRRRRFAAAATLLGISVRNAQLFREVRENSLRDGLTGCFNRTHAIEVIDAELRRARRSQAPTSLIMFDIDHFKDVNDRYGHLCGDAVLAAVGSRMRGVLRGSDVKCRYGGEEFLVLLPETLLEGAKRVADMLRRALSDMQVVWKDEKVQITASFGVAVALPSEVDTQALIGRADVALYRAKDQGRNCVRLAAEAAVA